MEIRDIIEKKIREAGITKSEVASRMGIASQNLNSMMSTPTWQTLKRIASALGLSVSELVRDETEEQSNDELGTTYINCPHCGKEIRIKAE